MSQHGSVEAEVVEKNPRRMSRRRFLGTTVATGAALAVGPGAVSAGESYENTGRDGLNWDSDYVQNPYISVGTLTKEKHPMEWGTDDAALANYANDAGEKDALPGHVDREDTENVVTLRADKMDFPDAYAFPRGITYDDDADSTTDEVDVSALDATHYTVTNATNGSVTVSDVSLGVEKSIEIASSAVAAGETVKATFDLATVGSSDGTITEEVAKRYFQTVVNTTSLAAGAKVELVLQSSDGDEKVLKIGDSYTESNADVIAVATGYGQTAQQRLGDLATGGSGDGSMEDVTKFVVRISEADATIQLTALNGEKKRRWTFGSYLKNEGTDSEERVTRYEPSGKFTATGLDTLGTAVSDADARALDVEFPFRYTMKASGLDYQWQIRELSDDPVYDYELVTQGKMEMRSGYDLTHATVEWADDVTVSPDRYREVWTTEGVKDTDFADIDDDTQKTFRTSNYDSEGTAVSYSTSITTGTVLPVGSSIKLVSDQREGVKSESGGGGAVAAQEGGGSVWVRIETWIMAILAGLGIGALSKRSGR